MNAINAAVIGCGRIAWKFEHDPLRYKPCTHLGALLYWQRRDKALRLSAFCDLEAKNARGAAHFASAPAAEITTDFRDVIAIRPDLLVIAADTAAHFEILTAAFKAKIPRIVIEKPVAFSPTEVKSLRRLAGQSSGLILPNYERRYHPKYLQLKKKIGNTSKSYRGFFAIGTGAAVSAAEPGVMAGNGQEALRVASAGGKDLYADQKSRDEGVLLHDTTHLLDLAQFFYGNIVRHEVIAGQRKHLLFLEHANGAAGVIETNLGIGAFHLELEIHTPRERIIVGNGFLSEEKIQLSPHYKNFKAYAAPARIRDKKFAIATNPFVMLYERALYGKPDNAHFLEALANCRNALAAG